MSHAGQLSDEAVSITDSHWQLIAESIPHIVWTAASDGRVEYLNQLGNYTGWSPEVTYNRDWLEVLHPDGVRSAERIWRNVSRMGTPYTAEYRIRRTDGEYRWHVSRGLPVRNASGQIVKWIGTATDNHDQRTNEARLREAHRTTEEALTLLATIQAEAPVGFGFVDRDRCLVRLNQELASMTGAPVEDLVGRPVPETVPHRGSNSRLSSAMFSTPPKPSGTCPLRTDRAARTSPRCRRATTPSVSAPRSSASEWLSSTSVIASNWRRLCTSSPGRRSSARRSWARWPRGCTPWTPTAG